MSEINEDTKTIDPELLMIPEIKEAIELSEQAGYSKAELAAYDVFWDTVSTEKTLISDHFKKGHIEGHIKGRMEGHQEERKAIAKTMLLENMDISLISKVTGLSISEIESLK